MFVVLKTLKLPEKKNGWKEISSSLGINIVSAQKRHNMIRTGFISRQKPHKNKQEI